VNKHSALKDSLTESQQLNYGLLKTTVDKVMNHNKYSIVSLNRVFEGLFPVTPAGFRGHHQSSKK
jgi:hypothetical protein